MRCSLYKRRQDTYCIGMQPQFRLIDYDHPWKAAFRLEEKCNERNSAECAVRYLMRTKYLVDTFLSPIETNAVVIPSFGLQFKVAEERRDLSNCANNSRICGGLG